MKTLLILILTTALFLTASAQDKTIDANIRLGMKTKPASPVIAAGIDFRAHGFAVSPEMIVDISNSEPANMGIKISYEHAISERVSIRAGAGLFFQLYSVDAYDINKNGYAGNYFFSVQYDKWFGEVEYMGCMRLSIGVRETIFNVQ